MMTNDTTHERDHTGKDMSLDAIKKRHTERQSAVKRLREAAGSEQKTRKVDTQDNEEEQRDD